MSRARMSGRLFIAVLVFAIAGCAVTGDRDTVSVRHMADKLITAQMAADDHCRVYGRKAVHVMTSPASGDPSYLFLNMQTSTFECRTP